MLEKVCLGVKLAFIVVAVAVVVSVCLARMLLGRER